MPRVVPSDKTGEPSNVQISERMSFDSDRKNRNSIDRKSFGNVSETERSLQINLNLSQLNPDLSQLNPDLS